MKRLLTLIFSLGVFACGLLASEDQSPTNSLQTLCANGSCSMGGCSTGTCNTYSTQASPPQTYYSTPLPASMPYASQNQTVYYSSTPVYPAGTQYSPVQYSNVQYSNVQYSNVRYSNSNCCQQQPIYYSSTPMVQNCNSQPVVYQTVQSYPTMQYSSVPCSQPVSQVQYTPVQSYPAQSYSVQQSCQPCQVQSGPVQSCQVQYYPGQAYPTQSYPVNSYPASTSYQTVPGVPVVSQSAPAAQNAVAQKTPAVEKNAPIATIPTETAEETAAAEETSTADNATADKVTAAATGAVVQTQTAAAPAAVPAVESVSQPWPTAPVVYQPAVSTTSYQPGVIYNSVPTYGGTTYTSASPAYSTSNANSGYATGGLAQQKANQAARLRLRGHVGGGLGGARYEGVGWSSVSAQAAVQNCCYWGSRPTSEIGVCRGPDGIYYACVFYH